MKLILFEICDKQTFKFLSGVNSDQRVYARFLTTNPKPAVNNSNNNPSNTTSNSGNSSTQLVTEEINE